MRSDNPRRRSNASGERERDGVGGGAGAEECGGWGDGGVEVAVGGGMGWIVGALRRGGEGACGKR